MIIRTDNAENIIKDCAEFLEIQTEELLELAYSKDLNQRLDYLIGDKLLDGFYIHHICRKEKGTYLDKILPLDKAVNHSCLLNRVLLNNEIEFRKSKNKLIFLYRKEQRNLDDFIDSPLKNTSVVRLKQRLSGQDYCINGYQFFQSVKTKYERFLYYAKAPEIIRDLDIILGTEMVQEIEMLSEPGCAIALVGRNSIELKSISEQNFEKNYIKSALAFVAEILNNNELEPLNPIIRTKNNCEAKVIRWIRFE